MAAVAMWQEECEAGGNVWRHTCNGDLADEESTACKEMVEILLRDSDYQFCISSLPSVFLASSTQAQQHHSLTYHCEKKALSRLMLSPKCQHICMHVNIKMCQDCHTAFKCASELHGRCIECNDSSHKHRFYKGHCSCKDLWR